MRIPEISAIEKNEPTEQGFSEKKIARRVEGKQVDNSQVKKRKPLSANSKQKNLKHFVRRDRSQALSKDHSDLVK